MNQFRLFSIHLVGGALMLLACNTDSGTTATATASTEDAMGDGDTDATGDTMGDNDVAGTNACSPWEQDCPEGEKCVPWASTGGTWDANKCVDVLGDGIIGDPCKYDGDVLSTDDCGADSWCWNVDLDGVGVCTGFCAGTPEQVLCDDGYGCWLNNEGSVNLCLQECDPLLQNCPAPGDACMYNYMTGDFVCKYGTANLPAGEACGFIDECASGNTCLPAELFPDCAGFACCAAFCDTNDPTCDLMGTECVQFFADGEVPPDLLNIGVCTLPGA